MRGLVLNKKPVIPAKAGIPLFFSGGEQGSGTPAFAGATIKGDME